MSAVDRCTCIPHYQDAGAGLTEYVPEWDPSCSEHGEVARILASGSYTDRYGREWAEFMVGRRIEWAWIHDTGVRVSPIARTQMRLLIERDQHRDECRGVRDCQDHPVPRVFKFVSPFGRWSTLGPGRSWANDSAHPSFSEAMDAARALAVEP